ncbi:HFX_2341 family transcriptional regulator domain-containing protein [Candidatus Harpocratesius sp.]
MAKKKQVKKKITKPRWKVHIVYNSRERNRIIQPISQQKPNSLYYMHFEDGNRIDINLNYRDDNLSEIRRLLPECKIHEIGINYLDYYQIIGNLAKIINLEQKSHPNCDVKFRINIGTGSKMVAIANIDAHRLWDNIEIVYPYSEDYDPTADSMHRGTVRAAEPPKFEFKHPNRLLIQALQVIYTLQQQPNKFGHKLEYVELRDLFKYIFEVYKLIDVKPNEDSRKFNTSQYMRLDRNIISKLEKYWGFITTQLKNKNKRVFLTEKGEKMAKVFVNYDYGIDLSLIKRN